MQPYTYLLVNFFTIIICFIASFDRRVLFNKHFGAYFKAAFVAAVPFIAWDVWFTKMGVWWFDTNYTTGVVLLGLPLEEMLFFFCIPFSCVFTYYCLDKFFNLDWTNVFSKYLTWITVLVGVGVAIAFHDRIYPFVTGLVVSGTVIYLYYIAKVDWIGKASFVFFILLPGFFMVNGVLTGTGVDSPIVNYNPDQILNLRMLTIPIEDAVYGYAQFLIVIYLFKRFIRPSVL
ncbi:lycopene cyclase domain-containing protein [Xanthomarina sp.]|uniref:lycopene cyclase domain-containing protein n=1 Tax=Xanthomarina sp. TaxID=1931211 RepID=UPI002C069AC2|nr:lycopene cyclase domain-containing protein [Xanthomarina sp.]HLV40362.1 lycopene cyclase domain-containing protein [Xanthomarina sp.]